MPRRLLAPVLAGLLGLALAGCSDSETTTPERFALMADFTSMGPHLGHGFHARIWHADTGVEIERIESFPVTTPNFTVVIEDRLILGERYYLDFWADVDMDGQYDPPPPDGPDHAWRRTIGPVAGDTTISFVHDLIWVDIGWPE